MNAFSSVLPITEVITPADQAEVEETIARASRANMAVYPIGGGTALDYGATASRVGLGLSLAGLKRVIDYPARDLTITVEAGLTIAELAQRLAAEGQRLPVDVPRPDRATVGGAVSTSAAGPRRYRWGTLRDYVLGIRAVDGTGMGFSGGGRVVKNAAGYDLCRLLTGSLGTLAVITQVTLMVKPRPETSAFCACPVRDWDTAERLLSGMVHTQTLPSAVELLAGPTWRDEPLVGPYCRPACLAIAFEGSQVEVDWMLGQLQAEWRAVGVDSVTTCVGSQCEPLWTRLTEFPANSVSIGEAWMVEARALPSRTVACLEKLLSVDPACSIQAHAGNGVIRAWLSAAADQGAALLDNRLRQELAALGATVVARSRPPGVPAGRDTVWGPMGESHQLMQRIKNQFDPQGILNPGRFVFSQP